MRRLIAVLGLSMFLLIFCPPSGFTETEGAIELTKEQAGPITLQKAIALALIHNPELAVFSLETRAREARALQAGLLPNPNVQITVEDVAGSGAFKRIQSIANHCTTQSIGGIRRKKKCAFKIAKPLRQISRLGL